VSEVAGLEVTVKLADTEVFQNMLNLFREIANDESIPEEKRKHIVTGCWKLGRSKNEL